MSRRCAHSPTNLIAKLQIFYTVTVSFTVKPKIRCQWKCETDTDNLTVSGAATDWKLTERSRTLTTVMTKIVLISSLFYGQRNTVADADIGIQVT